jgi:hypothetical protein
MMPDGRSARMVNIVSAEADGGLAARIAALPDIVNSDPVLLRRGRQLNAIWQLAVGDRSFFVRIEDGRVVETRPAPAVATSADFAMIAAPQIWERLLAAEPPPGDHDFLAFLKRKELSLIGNLHPLMSRLLYFKGLLAALRAGGRS